MTKLQLYSQLAKNDSSLIPERTNSSKLSASDWIGTGAMNQLSRPILVFAIAVVAAFTIWSIRTRSAGQFNHETFKDAVYSALTNPVAFSKDHVKGGVGIIATIDPRNGTVEIHDVVAGSPADKAGLQAGDHVIAVNGLATAGRTLAENMESITGFSFGSVKLTVQRSGSTNREFAIDRTSWRNLRDLGMPIE